VLTRVLVDRYVAEELAITSRNPLDHFCDSADLLRWGALGDDLPDSFTVEAYQRFMIDRTVREGGRTAA
jgi:malate synthase